MKAIQLSTSNRWKRTSRWLAHLQTIDKVYVSSVLNKYGEIGVEQLKEATPKKTGLTAESWYYKTNIDPKTGSVSLEFCNSNINDGVSVAIILQFGHGTATGGYVKGTNYINPVVRPIFTEIRDKICQEVNKR